MPTGSILAPTYRSGHDALSLSLPGAGAGDSTSLHSTSQISTRPPSYGRHFHDELVSPPGLLTSQYTPLTTIPMGAPLVSRLAHRGGRPRSTASTASSTCHITNMLQILTSTEPLTLTIDNNLLYPPPPSSALYHLPRVLTWSGTEISLARSLPWSQSRRPRYTGRQARDLALYTMRRTPFTNDIILVPRREGLKLGVMRGHRSLLGNMSWTVEIRASEATPSQNETVSRITYSKGRWKVHGLDGSSGRIIAREKTMNPMAASEGEYAVENGKERNVITIEGSEVELWLKDLVVAAWCSRIWVQRMGGSRGLLGRGFGSKG
jgi:hypothetical protein